jgi:hypothetical protein
MSPPKGRPTFEQAFLEVIGVAATNVREGLRVLRRCGWLGQEVMEVGGVALQSEVLHLGKLILVGVASSIGHERKLSIAGGRRGASLGDLSLVLSVVKGQSRSIVGASTFSSEPLRPFAERPSDMRIWLGRKESMSKCLCRSFFLTRHDFFCESQHWQHTKI